MQWRLQCLEVAFILLIAMCGAESAHEFEVLPCAIGTDVPERLHLAIQNSTRLASALQWSDHRGVHNWKFAKQYTPTADEITAMFASSSISPTQLSCTWNSFSTMLHIPPVLQAFASRGMLTVHIKGVACVHGRHVASVTYVSNIPVLSSLTVASSIVMHDSDTPEIKRAVVTNRCTVETPWYVLPMQSTVDGVVSKHAQHGLQIWVDMICHRT